MYSILEATGYTWPLNLLWSINISCLSENKMALLDLEWVSPSWYLLKMLSRWLELGKIKHSAAFVRRSTHPRGRIQGRAGFMPPLQPAEAEMKTMIDFLAGTPVAQRRSEFWGETGSQSSAREALSAHDPQRGSHATQIFAGKRAMPTVWAVIVHPSDRKTWTPPEVMGTRFITLGKSTDVLGASTSQAAPRHGSRCLLHQRCQGCRRHPAMPSSSE